MSTYYLKIMEIHTMKNSKNKNYFIFYITAIISEKIANYHYISNGSH